VSAAAGPGSRRADRAVGGRLLGAVIPSLVLAAWWLAARSGSAVVPTFGEVWDVLSHPLREPPDLQSPSLAFSVAITLARFAIGFSLAVLTAVPLGIAAARSPALERLLHPMVELARPINPVVLLPLLTVLLGLTSPATILFGQRAAWRHAVLDQMPLAMLLILWYGAFFPIYLAALYGVRSIRTSRLETLHLLGAGSLQELRWLLLPHALPAIANGMRIALGVTWLVIIAAELFPGTRSGLGYMLCTACKTSEYEYTFAAMILIGVIGLLTNGALRRFERAVGHWQAAER
jgi:NitT/TauT family transport system permease protein